MSQVQVKDQAQAGGGQAPRPGLELRGVGKQFGGVVAVEDVTLQVVDGEYMVLLGPSGCGKTTILRMLGGHEQPTSGDILLDGQRLNGVPAAKRPMTTVFQHFALFPHRDVLGNVEFGPQMHGVPKKERRQHALEMIRLVGLEEYRHRYPRELSGGQQQRVALARVLVTEPRLLLLDEPFGDLDRLLQLRMRVELRELQRQLGITFIHVTHNQEEALSMADRIVVMEGGQVQQVGSPTEITKHPRNVFVASFMGDNNILRGAVVGHEGNSLVIDIGCGTLAVPVPSEAEYRGGQPVIAAVRASAVGLSVADREPGYNELVCDLKATEYLGDTVKVHADAEGHRLIAKAPESRYDELRELAGKQAMASFTGSEIQLLNE